MTACIVTPAVAPGRAERVLMAMARWLGRTPASREAIDLAWVDTGLGRLSPGTLEDIGVSPEQVEMARQREAWQIAAALDSTRLL